MGEAIVRILLLAIRNDLWYILYSVFAIRNTSPFSWLLKVINSMVYFLSIHSSNDTSELFRP